MPTKEVYQASLNGSMTYKQDDLVSTFTSNPSTQSSSQRHPHSVALPAILVLVDVHVMVRYVSIDTQLRYYLFCKYWTLMYPKLRYLTIMFLFHKFLAGQSASEEPRDDVFYSLLN